MHVQPPHKLPANLTVALIQHQQHRPHAADSDPGCRPSLAHPCSQHLVVARRGGFAPQSQSPADAGPPPQPHRPAVWPYKWPIDRFEPSGGHEAEPPGPDEPYTPHRMPEIFNRFTPKFSNPAADSTERLIDLYA